MGGERKYPSDDDWALKNEETAGEKKKEKKKGNKKQEKKMEKHGNKINK